MDRLPGDTGDETESARAKTDLRAGFLARRVEDAASACRDARRGLEEQGGLADPGLAAEQDERSRDQPAPEDAVELGEVLAGSHPGRSSADQITVYKSMGHAVEDAAAAALVLKLNSSGS
jgi:ornithine cyclodeaminase